MYKKKKKANIYKMKIIKRKKDGREKYSKKGLRVAKEKHFLKR